MNTPTHPAPDLEGTVNVKAHEPPPVEGDQWLQRIQQQQRERYSDEHLRQQQSNGMEL